MKLLFKTPKLFAHGVLNCVGFCGKIVLVSINNEVEIMIIRKELETSQCFDVINYLNKVHGVPNDPRLEDISRIQATINTQKDVMLGMDSTKKGFEGVIPYAGSLLCNQVIAGAGLCLLATLSVPTIYSYMAYRDVKNGIKDVKNLTNDIAKTMYYNYEYQCKNDGNTPLTYEQVCDDAYAYEIMLQKYFEEQNNKKTQADNFEQEM